MADSARPRSTSSPPVSASSKTSRSRSSSPKGLTHTLEDRRSPQESQQRQKTEARARELQDRRPSQARVRSLRDRRASQNRLRCLEKRRSLGKVHERDERRLAKGPSQGCLQQIVCEIKNQEAQERAQEKGEKGESEDESGDEEKGEESRREVCADSCAKTSFRDYVQKLKNACKSQVKLGCRPNWIDTFKTTEKHPCPPIARRQSSQCLASARCSTVTLTRVKQSKCSISSQRTCTFPSRCIEVPSKAEQQRVLWCERPAKQFCICRDNASPGVARALDWSPDPLCCCYAPQCISSCGPQCSKPGVPTNLSNPCAPCNPAPYNPAPCPQAPPQPYSGFCGESGDGRGVCGCGGSSNQFNAPCNGQNQAPTITITLGSGAGNGGCPCCNCRQQQQPQQIPQQPIQLQQLQQPIQLQQIQQQLQQQLQQQMGGTPGQNQPVQLVLQLPVQLQPSGSSYGMPALTFAMPGGTSMPIQQQCPCPCPFPCPPPQLQPRGFPPSLPVSFASAYIPQMPGPPPPCPAMPGPPPPCPSLPTQLSAQTPFASSPPGLTQAPGPCYSGPSSLSATFGVSQAGPSPCATATSQGGPRVASPPSCSLQDRTYNCRDRRRSLKIKPQALSPAGSRCPLFLRPSLYDDIPCLSTFK